VAIAVSELKIEISDVQPCVKKLKIEIPAEKVVGESESKWKEIAKYAQVQGFRKGKAPRYILEKMYSSTILGEVGQKLINEGYEAAIAEHKIDVLGEPSFQDVNVAPGKPISFSVVVETLPQISAPEFVGWEFERDIRRVDDKETESVTNSILEANSELVPVVDRGVKEGDYVFIDYAGSVDGVEEPKLSGKGQQMVIALADDNLFIDFHRNISGMKEGEEKEFSMELSKQYPDPSLAEKKAVFKVKINSVKEKVLPKLTDEFVAAQTAYKSVEEMKLQLRERAEEREKEKSEEDLRRKIMKKFRENASFDLPPKMVAQYAEMYGNRLLRTTREWGMDLRSQPDFDKAKFDENCREKGQEWARDEMIIESIAKQEKLEPDPAELERLQNEYAEFLKSEDKNTRYNAALFTLKEALQESVFKHIYGKIKVTDKVVDPKEGKEND